MIFLMNHRLWLLFFWSAKFFLIVVFFFLFTMNYSMSLHWFQTSEYFATTAARMKNRLQLLLRNYIKMPKKYDILENQYKTFYLLISLVVVPEQFSLWGHIYLRSWYFSFYLQWILLCICIDFKLLNLLPQQLQEWRTDFSFSSETISRC